MKGKKLYLPSKSFTGKYWKSVINICFQSFLSHLFADAPLTTFVLLEGKPPCWCQVFCSFSLTSFTKLYSSLHQLWPASLCLLKKSIPTAWYCQYHLLHLEWHVHGLHKALCSLMFWSLYKTPGLILKIRTQKTIVCHWLVRWLPKAVLCWNLFRGISVGHSTFLILVG